MKKNTSLQRIKNIIKKEWFITFCDVNTLMYITLFPLLLVAQVLVGTYLVIKFIGPYALMNTILGSSLKKFEAQIPAITNLLPQEKFLVLFYLQFPIYFLLIPAMIASSITTFSIIEEKQTRTLEPLLATPVRTWELLLGKALAGSIPSIAISWICSIVFLLGIKVIGKPHLIRFILNPSWFLSLFLLVPLVTILSFMLGIIGSSRAKDPKNAQNFAVILIIPILAIVGIQISGIVILTSKILIAFTLAITILDVLTLRIAVALFQRETIIVKWK